MVPHQTYGPETPADREELKAKAAWEAVQKSGSASTFNTREEVVRFLRGQIDRIESKS